MTVGSLSTLALKIGANMFDISSGQSHISIRDQIVRARLLVRDIKLQDPNVKRILVIGGGVAGVSAAIAAASVGIHVELLEKSNALFSLQSNVTKRFVGPFMYEWPSPVYKMQSYPPKLLASYSTPSPGSPQWEADVPLEGSEMAKLLRVWVEEARGVIDAGEGSLSIFTSADAQNLLGLLRIWLKEHDNGKFDDAAQDKIRRSLEHAKSNLSPIIGYGQPSTESDLPDYIILGTGPGPENVAAPGTDKLTGTPFWQDDDLVEANSVDRNIVIVGGGDGALQDFLRATTGLGHPLSMLDKLLESSAGRSIRKCQSELLALEQEHRLDAAWTINNAPYHRIDNACMTIASRLAKSSRVRAAVTACVRPGTGSVTIIAKDPHFTKAYILNRFLVHLIKATTTPTDKVAGRTLKVLLGYEVVKTPSHGDTKVHYRSASNSSEKTEELQCDTFVVRFGPAKEAHEPVLALSVDARDLTRVSMSRIPLPFVAHN